MGQAKPTSQEGSQPALSSRFPCLGSWIWSSAILQCTRGRFAAPMLSRRTVTSCICPAASLNGWVSPLFPALWRAALRAGLAAAPALGIPLGVNSRSSRTTPVVFWDGHQRPPCLFQSWHLDAQLGTSTRCFQLILRTRTEGLTGQRGGISAPKDFDGLPHCSALLPASPSFPHTQSCMVSRESFSFHWSFWEGGSVRIQTNIH